MKEATMETEKKMDKYNKESEITGLIKEALFDLIFRVGSLG